VTGGRLLAVALLAALYLLTIGSTDPLDLAFGLVVGAVLVVGLGGRLPPPRGRDVPALPVRVAAFPPLVGAVLLEVARGTWDVGLRVLGLRPLEGPGVVLVPIGERSPLGVAVTGLLVGLSPGSMLLEVDDKRQMMLFHVIDARDPDAVRAQIDRLYQRHQRRVFP